MKPAFFASRLVLLDHRHRRCPTGTAPPARWRRRCRPCRARAASAVAADEGDVVEGRGAAGLLHLPDELGARGVGADHHHRVGLHGLDLLHRVLDVDRIALDRAERGDLQVALAHRDLDALQAGLAVGVVLVEHRDLLAAGRDHLLDDLLGLVVVAGAHVEDVAVERHAQRLGAGEHADQRHLGRRVTIDVLRSPVGVPT